LILISPKDFPAAFLAFFWGVGLVVAFHLPGRVLDVPALALVEGLLLALPPIGWAETGMVGIGMSPSKPGMGEMKLSKDCILTIETWDLKKMKKD
jgi:hypothetical protein